MKYIYEPGDKVTSYFTYVEEDKEKSTSNHRYMKVKCICGNKESIRTDNILKDVGCKQCGQLKRRATFSNKTKESIIKSLYKNYKRQATKRGYTFDITYELFKEYIFKDCYYCSVSSSNTAKQNYRVLNYNGIDRVDNSKGYDDANIVPCCGECNWMKNKLNKDQFLEKIKKIYNNLKL
jgi:ribosomal protein S27E